MNLSLVNPDSPYLIEVVKWLNDKQHTQFSNQRFRSHTVESQREYCSQLQAEGHFYFFGFEDEVLLGTVTILDRRPHKTAEIGILIANSLKGQGFGKKLFRTASELALNEMGFEKLRAGCLRSNVPMIKILESCGFKNEAIFEREEIWEGNREDLLFFARHAGG